MSNQELAHKIVENLYNTGELKCNDLRVLPEVRAKVKAVIDQQTTGDSAND